MRIIIVSLFVLFLIQPVLAQPPSKTQKPVKNQMQGQMLEAINELNKQIVELEKQIVDAKKNKEDESVIKDLENQAATLKKQVVMMQGVNKTVSGISEKTFEQAGEEESIVSKKDVTRINMLPKKILTEAELILFIKNVHVQVEKMIPAAEKTEALKVYNETKAEYKSVVVTANAATGYWMLGHWEKALFIMGKVCIDDITDADNLNNYASFLISTGGEQAAIPILLYLDSRYPDNSTIKNNIGQAWFGLGDLDNAKKNLDEATVIYPGHSLANATLSNLYQSEGDNERAITFLKASLKETYDPEKEQQLLNLGYKITYSDMPPFDYPMKKDPFGLIPFLDTWNPNTIQSSIGDQAGALALQRYLNGIGDFDRQLNADNEILDKELRERNEKLSKDKPYQKDFLQPYNCPAYLQAGRSLQLLSFDIGPGTSPLITQLWFPFSKTFQASGEIPLSIVDILKDCQEVWDNEVLKPMRLLADEYLSWLAQLGPTADRDCEAVNQVLNKYLQKRKEIYERGVELVKTEFVSKSTRLDAWIKLYLYAAKDDPPKTIDESTIALVSHLKKTISRNKFKNKMYKGIIQTIDKANMYAKFEKTLCEQIEGPELAAGTIDFERHNMQIVDCEFRKVFITPIRYKFGLYCNTTVKEKDPNLEERKPDINKGSVQNSNAANQNPEPLQTRGGPYNSFYEQEEQDNIQAGPLSAENKVISQSYIEYNKWGNFTGFKFQLNKDCTDLKDPDSVESGVDSRWSWNAIASPKKGFLNKLPIK